MLVPFRGRSAVRIARLSLAIACLAWFPFTQGARVSTELIAWMAYAAYAVVVLFERRFDEPPRSIATLALDAAIIALARWTPIGTWAPVLAYCFVLVSAVVLHPLPRTLIVCGAVVLIALVPPSPDLGLWFPLGAASLAVAFALQKSFLEKRLSHAQRHNVLIRSQAQNAGELERQRIAADFHDGPLQNFISFQMRLEIIRKLLARDVSKATAELESLQELCRNQVAELRGFVRMMRPVDPGLSLSASLSKMVEQFERDTGIAAAFQSEEFHDPAQTEISLEVLQIVRETLTNVHKHAGATRIRVGVNRYGQQLHVRVQDDGGGFPFSGQFNLEELELMRLGPVSIKRRVRLLGGELEVNSRPGHGATLEVRVPLTRAGDETTTRGTQPRVSS